MNCFVGVRVSWVKFVVTMALTHMLDLNIKGKSDTR